MVKKTRLIVNSYLSPHQYRLKPSDIDLIEKTDLFIWVGKAMLPQITKYIAKRKGRTLELLKVDKLHLLGESHSHNDEKETDLRKEDHKHQDEEGLGYDPHIWLSTDNSMLIARSIYAQLVMLDAENEGKYLANLNNFVEKVGKVKIKIEKTLGKVKNNPYFSFHDAYSYFEEEFSLSNKGVLRVNVTKSIKAKTMYLLQKEIRKYPNACLFYEPQFDKRIVEQLAFKNKIGILDPIGYKEKADGFFAIITNLANGFNKCLSENKQNK